MYFPVVLSTLCITFVLPVFYKDFKYYKSNTNFPLTKYIETFNWFVFPDTDTKFNGITAFPGSSTIVTGLKYKNKYPGHEQELDRTK